MVSEGLDYSSEKESTNVDQIGVRFQAVFTGIVHSAGADHTGKKLTNFRSGLHDLLLKLSKDRRRFTYSMGGMTILSIAPGAAEPGVPAAQIESNLDKMDIGNGPHVQVQVVKVTAGISAHVRFTISAVFPNCGVPGSVTGAGLVNFRFWVHEDIDARTWLTSRTWIGRLRVAHKNISPHALADAITVPPLEDGFQRQVVNWHESSDGLHLDFTIRDQEQIAAAPWNRFANVGAIDWDGSLTASTGNNYGFTGNIDFRLRLTGAKTTSTADLIAIGMKVADRKARFFEAAQALQNPNATIFLDNLAVTEHFSVNSIEITASIRHTGSNLIDGIMSVGANQVLGTPMGDLGMGYDPEKNFAPGQTAGVGGLFLSLLQTPCQPSAMPDAVTPKKKKKPRRRSREGGDDYSQGYLSGELQPAASAMSPSQLSAMYLEYLLDSEIVHKSGRVALPTGAANGSDVPTIAVVNLHRSCAIRQIRIDATRLNASPQLPDWLKDFTDQNDIKHTRIGEARLCCSGPQISADNRKVINRATMHVDYALSRPPGPFDSIPIGCVPYRVSNFNDPSREFDPQSLVNPALILS